MKHPLCSICAMSLLFCLICSAVAVGKEAPASRPNILMIVSEDNGPELGCYGNKFVSTPHLDRLASEGVRFDRAFVPQAGCSQSRAAFLTGLFPHQNGQIGLATWRFRMFRPDTPNIIKWLKESGYRTGIIGKLHVNPESAFPFDFHKIPDANFGRKGLERYAKFAAEFFTQDDRPFFLSVNYPDAHIPFLKRVDGLPNEPLTADQVQPLPHLGLNTNIVRGRTADYLNCMSRLDHLVGDLLERLRAAGHAEDTMVVYFGDHGSDTLRAKRTCYEAGLRIPLIIRWPGKVKPGEVRAELVSTLDLVPTYLQAAGLPAVESLPGRSLLPLLSEPNTKWRDCLFTEYHTHSSHNYHPSRAVRDDRFKLIRSLLPGEYAPDLDRVLLRNYGLQGYKEALAEAPPAVLKAFALTSCPPEYQLYDLQDDPYEFHNLADDPAYAKIKNRLSQRLDTWRHDSQDPFLDPQLVTQLRDEIAATKKNDEYIRPKKWSFYEYVNEANPNR